MPKRSKKKIKSSRKNPFLTFLYKYRFIFIISFAVSGLLFYSALNKGTSSVLGTSTNEVTFLTDSEAANDINSSLKSTECGNVGQASCPKNYFTKVVVFNDKNKNLNRGSNDTCFTGYITLTVNGVDYKTYLNGCGGNWIRSKLKKNTISAPAEINHRDPHASRWKILGLNYKDPTTDGKFIFKKGKRTQLMTANKPNVLSGSTINFSYQRQNCAGDSDC